MKRNRIPAAGIAALLLLCLAGCGQQITKQVSDKVKEEAQDFLMKHGDEIAGAIDDGLDALQEYGAVGRKHYFENETEAESYLLDSLEERYGMEFMIVEQHSYDKYGPIYGDVYIAKAAPADSPEQVFFGRAKQAGSVSDTYWKIIFQDAMSENLEEQLRTICEEKEYIQSFSMKIDGSYTERAWREDDTLNDVISASGAHIMITVILDREKTEEEYADMVLDFLESLYPSPRKTLIYLNFRAGEKGSYVYFRTIPTEEQSCTLSREELIQFINDYKSISPFD